MLTVCSKCDLFILGSCTGLEAVKGVRDCPDYGDGSNLNAEYAQLTGEEKPD